MTQNTHIANKVKEISIKAHIKNYFEYHGLTSADFVECKICKCEAVDIHHINFKKMGGAKVDNSPKNLIALCRKCHDFAHEGKFSREFLFKNNGVA